MPRYSKSLLDHASSPRNGGEMESPTAVGRSSLAGRAPYTTIFLEVRDGQVSRAMFQTFGCGVSIASCSALTELAMGKSVGECADIVPLNVIKALDGVPAEKRFCVDLAIQAMRSALADINNDG